MFYKLRASRTFIFCKYIPFSHYGSQIYLCFRACFSALCHFDTLHSFNTENRVFPAGRERGGKKRRKFRPIFLYLSWIDCNLTLHRLPDFAENAVPEGRFLPDGGGRRVIGNRTTGHPPAANRSAVGGKRGARVVWKAHRPAFC